MLPVFETKFSENPGRRPDCFHKANNPMVLVPEFTTQGSGRLRATQTAGRSILPRPNRMGYRMGYRMGNRQRSVLRGRAWFGPQFGLQFGRLCPVSGRVYLLNNPPGFVTGWALVALLIRGYCRRAGSLFTQGPLVCCRAAGWGKAGPKPEAERDGQGVPGPA